MLIAVTLGGCGKHTKAPKRPRVRWHTRIEPACRAAKAENKPVLVYFWASWDVASKTLDHQTFFDDDVRAIIDRDYVALKIDRSGWYMRSPSDPLDDDVREAEAAARQFKPDASKYATVLVTSADCEREIDRLSVVFEPREFAARLRAARRRAAR